MDVKSVLYLDMMIDAICWNVIQLRKRHDRIILEYWNGGTGEGWGRVEAHLSPNGNGWEPAILPRQAPADAEIPADLNAPKLRAWVKERVWMCPILPLEKKEEVGTRE